MSTTEGVSAAALEAAIIEKLKATHVELKDTSGGCGQMFEAVIVSQEFAKKTSLMRHRLVNSALKDEISRVHAWTQKCFTEEEWERKKASEASGA
ncbi:uncharacterized protein LAJ45_02506 [Morchella importuna]|uniref:Bola-like protein n=1 Tax=Morchella conica CCBAS932 TaxID=1392247 RepID=A0A3N4KWE0_9PEZI|nr:uncharacterized protein LAJ45_02506 [Morchella importuna]KAH8153693.1 hypothetical protein LAJ45_02506 [Morchella importuna]RPB14847.1 bola-like protein [Morchella conica CCBAS932]